MNKQLKDEQVQHQQDLEQKASSMIMSVIEQIKTTETKTQQMEQELAKDSKKYEKLVDAKYLDQIEKNCEQQAAQIKKLEKENHLIEQKTKQIDRQLDKQQKTEERAMPRIDNELKSLKAKLAYTTKKYETEYNKLIDLSAKRKEIKERE